MSNEKDLEIVDLIAENQKLKEEKEQVEQEKEKLQQQMVNTEQTAIELVDTFYNIQHEKSLEKKCNFDKNGDYPFYYIIENTIKKCVEDLKGIKDNNDKISKIIEELESLWEYPVGNFNDYQN